jgi:lysophospholipase L1-like esterase
MKMTSSFKALSGLAVAGILSHGAVASAGVFRLRRMVVVGDSLLAGFGSGGLVSRGQTGQRFSAPAQLARQAGVRLPQPLMSGPGVPPPLRIEDINQNGMLDAGEVRRSSDAVGFRAAPGQAVRNLAVPGEDIRSVFDTLDAEDVGKRLVNGRIEGREVLKFLILGVPLRDEDVSQMSRANALRPSFLMVWLGNNDLLPMATRTDPEATRVSVAAFGTAYRRFLNRLADAGADMAVANLPDVTQVAALRGPGLAVTGCRANGGVVEPVAPTALVSLALDPTMLPTPPCAKVLDPTEQAAIRATVVAFNREIADAIAEVESSRGIVIAPVDMFGLFDQVARDGYDVRGDGSTILHTEYLGGLFSLDGVHPTRTGQGLIANAFIDAINARFGDAIPRVDLGAVAARDPLVGSSFRPAAEAPFGLIKDEDVDVGGALDDAFSNLAEHTRDIFKRLKNRVRDVFQRIEDAV